MWQDDLQQVISSIDTAQDLSSQDIIKALTAGRNIIDFAFYEQADIALLLEAQTQLIDQILCHLWQQHYVNGKQAVSIVAVGGYGRAEMHPHSDIDLLILLESEPDETCQAAISGFITQLWDLKLEIGHSVRTLEECVEVAQTDLTVITNLIEARLLCGNTSLFDRLDLTLSADTLWDSPKFFQAKLGEQQERYTRFGDTAYRVEPNLKDGPGGLRDLHMISWVTKREYNTLSLHELYILNLLTEKEYNLLISCRNFLWKVRYAIHLLAKRKEDRLLLEHQQTLAKIFGYDQNTDETTNEAVEKFMHRYYQTITKMERMNELLLGIFREEILPAIPDEQEIIINEWCKLRGSYLSITNVNIFVEQPHTLLEIFYVLQITSGVRGLTPQSIRIIHAHLHIIDDNYRATRRHQKIFMNIMSESHGITHALRRMNRYGILAAWIPEFANIVGRMQFDLFHAYTVDDHTLRVISMVRRNTVAIGAEDMPYESLIFKSLPDPKILYLAALFHDIAKGRGGDHSTLGAKDAYEFCRRHHLDLYDSHLVSWLVENHLLLSVTAQRQDISDPEVIQTFANKMLASTRLDYLYLLTIADMRATNPNLWTGWKHSLLQGLYKNTRRVLKQSIAPSSYKQLVEQKRESILEQLPVHTIDKESGIRFCNRMGDDYLHNHTVDTILWQMSYIQTESVYPLIQLRQDKKKDTFVLFIYTNGSDELFAQTTFVLSKLNINVVAANMMLTPNGFSLETLYIIGQENQPLSDSDNQNLLINALREEITKNEESKQDYEYKIPRLLKVFDVKTHIQIEQDSEKQQTRITLRTIDLPGLLAKLSRIFYELECRVVGARITTLGEEAEDIFYLTGLDNLPILDEKKLELLYSTLLEKVGGIEQPEDS